MLRWPLNNYVLFSNFTIYIKKQKICPFFTQKCPSSAKEFPKVRDSPINFRTSAWLRKRLKNASPGFRARNSSANFSNIAPHVFGRDRVAKREQCQLRSFPALTPPGTAMRRRTVKTVATKRPKIRLFTKTHKSRIASLSGHKCVEKSFAKFPRILTGQHLTSRRGVARNLKFPCFRWAALLPNDAGNGVFRRILRENEGKYEGKGKKSSLAESHGVENETAAVPATVVERVGDLLRKGAKLAERGRVPPTRKRWIRAAFVWSLFENALFTPCSRGGWKKLCRFLRQSKHRGVTHSFTADDCCFF